MPVNSCLKCSVKDASNLDLQNLTENDQEDLYTKLSNEVDYHPNILSVHYKFNEPKSTASTNNHFTILTSKDEDTYSIIS